MPANRDKNQKPTFVYSNLYHLYRKGVDAAKGAEASAMDAAPRAGLRPGLRTDINRQRQTVGRLNRSHVLKTGQIVTDVRVRDYKPSELVGQSRRRQVTIAEGRKQVETVQELKSNLSDLKTMHSRLRVMLDELEKMVDED